MKMVLDYLSDCKEDIAFLRECEWPACMNDLVNVIIDFAASRPPTPQECLLCIRAGMLAELGENIQEFNKDSKKVRFLNKAFMTKMPA